MYGATIRKRSRRQLNFLILIIGAFDTAIETCGHFSSAILPELVNTTDLFLWDIKDTDNMRHLANTGVSNDRIISNLKEADTLGVKTILRCILLKSINLNTERLKAIAEIYCALSHCNGVESYIRRIKKTYNLGFGKMRTQNGYRPKTIFARRRTFYNNMAYQQSITK